MYEEAFSCLGHLPHRSPNKQEHRKKRTAPIYFRVASSSNFRIRPETGLGDFSFNLNGSGICAIKIILTKM